MWPFDVECFPTAACVSKVRIELFKYADSVALPAAAAATIGISCMPDPQQQVLLWAHAGTDRRTDRLRTVS